MEADPVFQEFVEVLNALAGTHAFALQGISEARKRWEAHIASAKPPTTLDSTVYVTNGPHDAPSTVAYSKWRLGDLPELLGGGGVVETRVSQQWVVSLYAEWEEHYRPRITVALGLDEPLKLPPFGDLRLFRHDIVHNRGRASVDNSGNAKIFTDWFEPGETMFFDTYKVAEFMETVAVVEQLPRAD